MCKSLSYMKNWGKKFRYCWHYGPSKLLLCSIEYRLDQLSNSTRNSSKLDKTIFWKPLSKERSGKTFKFFDPATPKWSLFKIFAKLKGCNLLMTNIFKLHKYQTFGLIKMHNMNKVWFANNKFSFWKSLVYD